MRVVGGQSIRLQAPQNPRRMRLTPSAGALGYLWPAKPREPVPQRPLRTFLFAIETLMRPVSPGGLKPADVHLKERFVNLPRTKNGDAPGMPLSTNAVTALKLLQPFSVPVFGIEPALRDALKKPHFYNSLRRSNRARAGEGGLTQFAQANGWGLQRHH